MQQWFQFQLILRLTKKIHFFVKSLVLIIDENPSPLVSKFKFNKKVENASLTTRVRVDKYTYVRAIAETSDGKKYMVANFVKAAGGCSAPSLADMDAVMARLGKMKMKFIETKVEKGLNKAEFLISHPNYSGLQFNQLTRSEIPAHFINYIKYIRIMKLYWKQHQIFHCQKTRLLLFTTLTLADP